MRCDVKPGRETVPAKGSQIAQQPRQLPLCAGWIDRDSRWAVDRDSQQDAAGSEEGPIIKLAGIEWPRHGGELARGFDRLTVAKSVRLPLTVTMARPSAGFHKLPSEIAVIARTIRVTTRAGSPWPVPRAGPRPQNLCNDPTYPGRPRRLGHAPAQVPGRLTVPASMVPCSTDGDECPDERQA